MSTYQDYLSERLYNRLKSIKESSDVFDLSEEIHLTKELVASLIERRETLLPHLNEAVMLRKPVEEALKLLNVPSATAGEKARNILTAALQSIDNINSVYTTEQQLLNTLEQVRKLVESLMKVTLARKMFISANEIDQLMSSIVKVLAQTIKDKAVLEQVVMNIKSLGDAQSTGRYVSVNTLPNNILEIEK